MSVFNCFNPRKEIICFLLVIHFQVNITNVIESVCAVEWFLPFHSFINTQCSAVVFKSLIQFALIIIHRTNPVESGSAVEWFLPFHSFFDTQCSAKIFKSLIQFALIVILQTNSVELISFFNCIFLFLVFDYRKWFLVWLFPNFCRWNIHFFCPYMQDVNYRLSDNSCKIKTFGWPISFMNTNKSLLVF